MMNKLKTIKVTCFGEVLWDVFPEHKKIGGAPLNVALRMNSLGVHVSLISRVGKDENGEKLMQYLEENNLDSSTIQIDSHLETGVVHILLDEKGSATYTIKHPVAWDKIQPTDITIDLVKETDAFIFGSLACRDSISRNTLLSLLEYAKFKVFDVNLRPPHYSINLLVQLMSEADLIKLNDEELYEICNHLGKKPSSINEMITFLAENTNTRQICVTQGKDGATLFIDNNFYRNKGYQIKVQDTVGAGDSFLATLISELLSNIKPQTSLNIACAVGSLVASKKGANPKIKQEEIVELMNQFNE